LKITDSPTSIDVATGVIETETGVAPNAALSVPAKTREQPRIANRIGAVTDFKDPAALDR